MASEALIGAVSGVGVGILIGLLFLIVFVCVKRRRNNATAKLPQTSPKIRKRSFPPTGPIFIKPNIQPFEIPPIRTFEIQTKPEREPNEQQTNTLSPPAEDNGRRPSLQLSDILTNTVPEYCPRRKSSPHAISSASNEQAIATLYAQQKKALGKKNKLRKSNASSSLGKLEFSLFYDQNMQELQINIFRGMQIYIPGNQENTTNFVIKAVILFDGEEVWQDKTKPYEACCDPYINEQLIVHGLPVKRMRKGALKLMIMDVDTLQYGGEVVYPLCNLPFNFAMNEVMKINDVENEDYEQCKQDDSSKYGELLVSMCHNRNEKHLTVGVEAAKGLPQEYGGSIDSYVKVDIMYLGKRLYSRATKVVPRNRSPIYENENFHFELPDDKLPQITVVLKVKHRGRMKDKRVGIVKLGYDADQELEYKHLEQVLDKPHLSIENWHVLRKYR